MPHPIHWTSVTDIGRFRRDNEDHVTCIPIGENGRGVVVAVSDGVGGANAGEVASAMAVAMVEKAVAEAGRDANPELVIENAIYEAHSAISDAADPESGRDGMACTLSIAWVIPNKLFFAHIGDSRIYHHHRGVLTQLSHDHTVPGQMLQTGTLTESEARNHPRRNLLLKAIGAGLKPPAPQIGTASLAAGDTLLLCSDGLTSGLWDKDLTTILSTATAATLPIIQAKLLSDSLAACGRDNTTLALVHIA